MDEMLNLVCKQVMSTGDALIRAANIQDVINQKNAKYFKLIAFYIVIDSINDISKNNRIEKLESELKELKQAKGE